MNWNPKAIKAVGTIALLLAGILPAMSSDDILLPKTKVRLTVVQWNPVKGDYQSWQAIGGEFTLSEAGALQLPVIGRVEALGRDTTALADEISSRLKSMMGLLEKPNATVEVLEYPPIYVVGDATTPGEYRYRTGLTALQALALSGGPLRDASSKSEAEIRLVGELRGMRNDILRTKARLARLNAEISGAPEIKFENFEGDADTADIAAAVEAQERAIFVTRIKENARQTSSLEDLRKLLYSEIDVLEEKVKAADIGVKYARQELDSVTILVDKGLAINSRRSDLEQKLASYQADRLDQVTAIMRARQSITEATRSLEGLEDRRKTEVAGSLQQEMANLERLRLNQETSQKILLETLASKGATSRGRGSVEFTVTRNTGGTISENPADESTVLTPGDVVTIRIRPAATPPAEDSSGMQDTTGSLSTADASSSGAGQ